MKAHELRAQIEELRLRLEEAEETITAIRSGAVDAFVVEGSSGHRVYTLEGADRPYRLLVEQMQQGAALLQVDGIMVYCNLQLAELLQIPHERLIGESLGDFVLPQDRPAYEQLLLQAKAGTGQGEVRFCRLQGNSIPTWLSFSVLPSGCGAELGLLVSDLRARKQQEELATRHTQELVQSERALRALASQLSVVEQRERRRLATELHDYLAQLLVVGSIKAKQARHQARQRQPVEDRFWDELVEVFTEGIAYTRTLMAELSPAVLHESGLPSALHWLGQNMRRYGLTVEVLTDDDRLAMPEDQAVLLFQSMRELLWNVVKHAETDRAILSLKTTGTDAFTLSVQDEGKGFDVTHQEAPSVSHGFGLFSIRERITAMGGTVTIQAAAGKGTRVTLDVPKVPKGAIETTSASLAPVVSKSTPLRQAGAWRILLADDHAMVRQGLRGLLAAYPGLEVIGEAANGEEAVAMAHTVSPDVVVMDVNMPVMDGIAATKHLKQVLPHIKVIGLSVNQSPQTIDAMTEAGASAFVSKELVGDDLVNAIMVAVGPDDK
jgi:PAS domain S-box-containing protein